MEQDDILREYGTQGAKKCADVIAARFGVRRSEEATARRMSRIGVSRRSYATCPVCGGLYDRLMPSGMCAVCNMRRLKEEADAFEAKYRRGDGRASAEFAQAKRDYDTARQRAYRRAKREGALTPREQRMRENRCGDYVDLSRDLSRTSSQAKETFGNQ